ncbi:MAG: GLPGLI family protein [Bacteroidetes bacterium]|nr:GLPGLI family protein [Bacteroidota bacterium]
MKKITLLAFALLATVSMFAQTKVKEGTAKYKIDYDLDAEGQEMKAMLPSEMTMYFKGDKYAAETTGGMFDQKAVTNMKNQETIMLMDMMGNKVAVKISKDDIEKEKNKGKKPKVEITSDTKDIAGFKCTKAITTLDDGTKMEIWFTKDIMVNNAFKEGYDGIDGMMMEYSVPQKMFTMKMTCTEVKQGNVDDKVFEIPSDYKMMTKEELMKMSGGGH